MSKGEIIKFDIFPPPSDKGEFPYKLPNYEHETALIKWYGGHLAEKLGESALRLGTYGDWFTKEVIPEPPITSYPKYTPEEPPKRPSSHDLSL